MEAAHLDIVIREATEADFEELKELFEQGTAIHHAGEPGIIAPPSERPISRTFVSELMRDEEIALLVAALSDSQNGGHRLAGFAQLMLHEVGDHWGLVPRRYVEVQDVEVRAQYQGQGIGQRLMSAADEWARSKGASAVELTVWEFNDRARALYERLGFRTINRQMLKRLL